MNFLPHAVCLLDWWPIIGLSLVSDAAIAFAYFAIPLALVYFVRHMPALPFPGMFWAFSNFIVACGVTHVMDILELFWPIYWLGVTVNVWCGAASLITLVLLIRVIPRAMRLPGVSLAVDQLIRGLAQAARRAHHGA